MCVFASWLHQLASIHFAIEIRLFFHPLQQVCNCGTQRRRKKPTFNKFYKIKLPFFGCCCRCGGFNLFFFFDLILSRLQKKKTKQVHFGAAHFMGWYFTMHFNGVERMRSIYLPKSHQLHRIQLLSFSFSWHPDWSHRNHWLSVYCTMQLHFFNWHMNKHFFVACLLAHSQFDKDLRKLVS